MRLLWRMRTSRALHWPHLLAPKEERIMFPFLWMGTIALMLTTLAIYAYAAVSGF